MLATGQVPSTANQNGAAAAGGANGDVEMEEEEEDDNEQEAAIAPGFILFLSLFLVLIALFPWDYSTYFPHLEFRNTCVSFCLETKYEKLVEILDAETPPPEAEMEESTETPPTETDKVVETPTAEDDQQYPDLEV